MLFFFFFSSHSKKLFPFLIDCLSSVSVFTSHSTFWFPGVLPGFSLKLLRPDPPLESTRAARVSAQLLPPRQALVGASLPARYIYLEGITFVLEDSGFQTFLD
jgi:hypothetical protein